VEEEQEQMTKDDVLFGYRQQLFAEAAHQVGRGKQRAVLALPSAPRPGEPTRLSRA
jgi:hypothetical protein